MLGARAVPALIVDHGRGKEELVRSNWKVGVLALGLISGIGIGRAFAVPLAEDTHSLGVDVPAYVTLDASSGQPAAIAFPSGGPTAGSNFADMSTDGQISLSTNTGSGAAYQIKMSVSDVSPALPIAGTEGLDLDVAVTEASAETGAGNNSPAGTVSLIAKNGLQVAATVMSGIHNFAGVLQAHYTIGADVSVPAEAYTITVDVEVLP